MAAASVVMVLLLLSVVWGFRTDKQTRELLDSPSVIDIFNKAKSEKAKAEEQVSPLVKQAGAFALYLNPPPQSNPKPASRDGLPSVRPVVVAPKFILIGTSYYALRPNLSLALIDEPGKGLRWVRQSSEVGRLKIEEIKDGAVVATDGQKKFDIMAERPEKISLLKKPQSKNTASKSSVPVVSGDSNIPAADLPRANEQVAQMGSLPENLEQIAAFEELINRLKSSQPEGASDKTDSGQGTGDNRDAVMDELVTRLNKAAEVSDKEANDIGDLGKALEAGSKEPNSESNKINTRRAKRPSRPLRPSPPGRSPGN